MPCCLTSVCTNQIRSPNDQTQNWPEEKMTTWPVSVTSLFLKVWRGEEGSGSSMSHNDSAIIELLAQFKNCSLKLSLNFGKNEQWHDYVLHIHKNQPHVFVLVWIIVRLCFLVMLACCNTNSPSVVVLLTGSRFTGAKFWLWSVDSCLCQWTEHKYWGRSIGGGRGGGGE